MSDAYLKNVVEAALLAAARPVSVSELLQIFDEQSRPSAKQMRAVLEQLTADYDGRGVTIRETANGFRFQVRSEFSQEVSRLWPDRPGACRLDRRAPARGARARLRPVRERRP